MLLVSLAIFGAIVHQMIYDPGGTDYNSHIDFARRLHEENQLASAHILYQALIIGLGSVFPVSYEAAAWFTSTAFYVLTALILFRLLRGALPNQHWPSALLCAGVALALLLVTPITLLTIPSQNLYLGYVAINVYHNPTMVLLKPFALLLFVLSVAILDHRLHLSKRSALVGLLLVAFGLLAKPNYVLVLLPALLVVIAYRLFRRETADMNALIGALVVPMILLLGVQYLLMYRFISQGGGIVFAPLASFPLTEPSFWPIVPRLVLSILFPLVLYAAYFRAALRDTALNLAWLAFFAGAGQMYLFAEQGEARSAGNFWWSAQIGLFVLFVASMLFWLRHFRQRPPWLRGLCLGVFVLHLVSGVIFYLAEFQVMRMFTWW